MIAWGRVHECHACVWKSLEHFPFTPGCMSDVQALAFFVLHICRAHKHWQQQLK